MTAARSEGSYLELLDEQGDPVLRLHLAMARDAVGVQRPGAVRLLGARAEDAPERYVVRGTLSVEMTVELQGLTAPVVIWARGLLPQNRRFRCGTP